MRLTLRTLLAYLDDILEPLEIKTIGQKVSESVPAQELIARIKQVTRRRRITAPSATGPNSFEPNMVAEYLDNVLPSDDVAELEKICLESDVHLAEVASCHQILTLVLGEPAVVPPTARERMYSLVRGREAIPFRKASAKAQAGAPSSADADADEMFLLGLPFYRQGSWLRWALPLAALLLFVIVGVALYQLIYGVQQPVSPSQLAQRSNAEPNVPDKSGKVADNGGRAQAERANEDKKQGAAEPPSTTPRPEEKQSTQPQTPQGGPPNPTGGTPTQAKTDASSATGTLEKTQDNARPAPRGREAPPSNERVEIGQYRVPDSSSPSLLVQHSPKDGWSRIKPGSQLYTGDQLMSLPGYVSEVRLNSGVHLILRGHVREFTPPEREAMAMDQLQESAVVLHKPKDTDVDLTLLRGRLYLSNHKEGNSGALVVRLRFEKKAWDLTLHPNAEVLVDLLKQRLAGFREPLSFLKLFLLRGEAGIALEHERYPDVSEQGRAQFFWVSSNPSAYERPQLSKQELDFANRVLFPKKPSFDSPNVQAMNLALNAIKDRMTVDKPPQVALQETLGNNKFTEHQLALYCLAALDEVKDLFDVLGKADVIHAPDRDTAIFALRRWLDHGPGQTERLYNPETKKGLLLSELGYTTKEAEQIGMLLRDPTDEDILNTKYYTAMAEDLASDKVALAELARWWLSRICFKLFERFSLNLPNLRSFNAAMPQDRREAARKEVEQAIREGLLPPSELLGKSRPGAPPTQRK